MKFFLELSREHQTLPASEALQLLKPIVHHSEENLLLMGLRKDRLEKLGHRLAYTKSCYEFLFSCDRSELDSLIASFDWQSHYKKSFAVRLQQGDGTISEREIADLVWHRLRKPKVDLDHACSEFHFFMLRKVVVVGRLLWKNPSVHREKPLNHPTSLPPKLARGIVNLVGVERGNVLDPFCGVGGILVEAGIMGLVPVGYDINPVMVNAAKRNVSYFKIKKFDITHGDATQHKNKVDYIVTDVPYGKNTGVKDITSLYDAFLKILPRILKKRAVIVFPHWSRYKSLIKKHRLKIIEEFDVYVHKTMTRKVVLISR